MPRELNPTDRNKAVLHDPISGENLTLYYRLPTTTERVKAQNAGMTFKKGKPVFDDLAKDRAMTDLGTAILTGITPGDFVFDGKPITEQTPEWKNTITRAVPDILAKLGLAICGQAHLVEDDADDDTSHDPADPVGAPHAAPSPEDPDPSFLTSSNG